MNAEVVKTPAGAVNSRCCIKSGHIGMHGKVWQAWVKRPLFYTFVFKCQAWLKTQHPYRKSRNSSVCVRFRDIGKSVEFQ